MKRETFLPFVSKLLLPYLFCIFITQKEERTHKRENSKNGIRLMEISSQPQEEKI